MHKIFHWFLYCLAIAIYRARRQSHQLNVDFLSMENLQTSESFQRRKNIDKNQMSEHEIQAQLTCIGHINRITLVYENVDQV